VEEFGDFYLQYQKSVPMLIPWRGPLTISILNSLEHQRCRFKKLQLTFHRSSNWNMKNKNSNKMELSPGQRKELLKVLKARFEKNMNRHKDLEWDNVQARLEAHTKKLWSLNEMERIGGEPELSAMIKRAANTSFVIVLPKAPKIAEAYV
jgi:hypothetical protein